MIKPSATNGYAIDSGTDCNTDIQMTVETAYKTIAAQSHGLNARAVMLDIPVIADELMAAILKKNCPVAIKKEKLQSCSSCGSVSAIFYPSYLPTAVITSPRLSGSGILGSFSLDMPVRYCTMLPTL